jgi:hypothetical protein
MWHMAISSTSQPWSSYSPVATPACDFPKPMPQMTPGAGAPHSPQTHLSPVLSKPTSTSHHMSIPDNEEKAQEAFQPQQRHVSEEDAGIEAEHPGQVLQREWVSGTVLNIPRDTPAPCLSLHRGSPQSPCLQHLLPCLNATTHSRTKALSRPPYRLKLWVLFCSEPSPTLVPPILESSTLRSVSELTPQFPACLLRACLPQALHLRPVGKAGPARSLLRIPKVSLDCMSFHRPTTFSLILRSQRAGTIRYISPPLFSAVLECGAA